MAGYVTAGRKDQGFIMDEYLDQLFAVKADRTVVRAGAEWDMEFRMPEGEALQKELEAMRELTGNPDISEEDIRETLVYGDTYNADKVSLWRDVVKISCDEFHVAGLKADGRVTAVGENSDGECDVREWRGITDVACGKKFTAGLCADGKVIVAGGGEDYASVSGWTDVTAIAAGVCVLAGLREDGTVVAIGSDWIDPRDVRDWKDIVAIRCCNSVLAGLKADGTVAAAGNYSDLSCVSDWTDIIAISCGNGHLAGLRADGTVVAAGKNDMGQCEVSDWTDIAAVYCGAYCTVGVKTDGSAVVTKKWVLEGEGLSGWTDIVAVVGSYNVVIGLRGDGSVVWADRLGSPEKGVSLRGLEDWKDLKSPWDNPVFDRGKITEQEGNFLRAQMKASYSGEFFVKKVYTERQRHPKVRDYTGGVVYLVRYRDTLSKMDTVSLIGALIRKDEQHTIEACGSVCEEPRVSLEYEEHIIGEKYVTDFPRAEVRPEDAAERINRLYQNTVRMQVERSLGLNRPEAAPLFATEKEMGGFWDGMVRLEEREVSTSGEGWEARH